MKRRVDDARCDSVHAHAFFRVLHREMPVDSFKIAFGDHRHGSAARHLQAPQARRDYVFLFVLLSSDLPRIHNLTTPQASSLRAV